MSHLCGIEQRASADVGTCTTQLMTLEFKVVSTLALIDAHVVNALGE